MGDKLKLLFTDVITGQPIFIIAAPKRIPEEGRKLHRTNQKFEWLAGKSAAAYKQQREATMTPLFIEGTTTAIPNEVPTVFFKSADDFLDAISFVNSKQYSVTLLKQLRHYIEKGDLVGLRRISSSRTVEFAYYP